MNNKKLAIVSGRWSTKLNVLTLLGFINKIQVEQIPEDIRPLNLVVSHEKKKMIEKVVPEHTAKYIKSVCYYYVPKLTLETFNQANEVSKIMIANHFTQGKFDRFWVEKAFGKKKAQQIFTEYLGRTELLNQREALVEKTIINTINKKGCASRKEIIDNVPLENLMIHSCKPWEINEIQYKRNVAENIFKDIIEDVKNKYNLEYKRLNAEEKKKYNINNSKWYIFKKGV